jgi:hypothetical protein
LSKAFEELVFAVLFNAFFEYLTDEFDTDIFFINFAIVEPPIDDFGEFIDKLRKLEYEGISDCFNGDVLVMKVSHEVFGFIHVVYFLELIINCNQMYKRLALLILHFFMID